jgi:hypothetical protein
VDEFTQSKHHIEDKHLVDEPPLDEVWPALSSYFTGKPAETTVLAAHFTAFDIPFLRNDLRVCHQFSAQAHPATADLVADQVWAAGCRDPYIAEFRVVQTAVAGRSADLRAAMLTAGPCSPSEPGTSGVGEPGRACRATRGPPHRARRPGPPPDTPSQREATAATAPLPALFASDVI